MKPDTIVKLRDAFIMASDALQEELEAQAPKGKVDLTADLTGIVWEAAVGPKGAYEKTDDTNNVKYKQLLKAVQEHQGKLTIDNYFVWVFDNGHTIARRPKN